jgi:hypothetical protein
MVQVLKSDERDTDLLRLNDLARQHGLTYRKHGKTLYFDDRTGEDAFSDGCIFIARGLRAALAFAEGYDRAKGKGSQKQSKEELRKLGVFQAALHKSGLVDG